MISIYDIRGSLVVELINGKIEAGYHQLTWNGGHAASGVYFLHMAAESGTFHKTMKISLLK